MRLDVEVRVMPRAPFTNAYSPGAIFEVPVALGKDRYVAHEEELPALEEEGRIGVALCGQPQRVGP